MPTIQSAKVITKKNLAGNYWLIGLEFQNQYDFSAGQYVSVKVATDGTRRSYSITSVPGDKVIELLIEIIPGGIGSKYFLLINIGDTVETLGPMGLFTLASNNPMPNKLFIATGSGIAPIRGMITEQLKNNNTTGEIRLLWGMRHEEELFWTEEFMELNRKFPGFSYQVVLSKPGEHWHGDCGHVGDCLRNGFIIEVKDITKWDFYLCGNQDMIMETGAFLAGKGAKKENIHFEKFF